MPRESWERLIYIDATQVLGDPGRDRFECGQYVFLPPERSFEVELGELELAIGPEILIAVAAGHLVVPLDTTDHQQLLEQLWGLREGIEVPLAKA